MSQQLNQSGCCDSCGPHVRWLISPFGSGSPNGIVTANPGVIYGDIANLVFYFKTSGTSNTGWVVMQGSGGGGSGQVMQGLADPTIPPATPTSPALYTNLNSGTIFTWNTNSQAWQ